MSLFEMVQNKAWALLPAKLDEINAFVEARLSDSQATFDVAKGKSGNRAEESYSIQDGVAVIPVYGVIDKRMNMFTQFSGGTSTELLRRDIESALEDPKVSAIVLDIDSPGGSVDGTHELADFIFENRGRKPVIAYGNGMMASAAYWIGSAADQILAGETAIVGSIGVALTHFDRSVADEKKGIKRTLVYSGKYKRIASDEKPLSEEGLEYLQAMTDTYYSIFVEAVARNRGASVETVLSEMANGRDFIGKQAKRAGLVNDIGTLRKAIKVAKKEGGKSMENVKALQEKHPDLYQEVFDLGKASVDVEKLTAEAKEAGIQAERLRTVEIMGAGGDPKATEQAIREGIDAAGAYKIFFEAEKQNRMEKLEQVRTAIPESVGHGAHETGRGAAGDFMGLVENYRKEHKCGLGTAMKAIAHDQPELHDSWLATQPRCN